MFQMTQNPYRGPYPGTASLRNPWDEEEEQMLPPPAAPPPSGPMTMRGTPGIMPGPGQPPPVETGFLGGMMDPRRIQAEREMEEAQRRRSAYLAERAEAAEVKSPWENFKSGAGVLPLLAGVATMGVGALPMALAFGIGASQAASRSQKEEKEDLELASVNADYEMSLKALAGITGSELPASMREFEALTQGLDPAQKRDAAMVRLGLMGRKSDVPYSMVKFEGSDGRTRVGAFNRSSGQIEAPTGPGGSLVAVENPQNVQMLEPYSSGFAGPGGQSGGVAPPQPGSPPVAAGSPGISGQTPAPQPAPQPIPQGGGGFVPAQPGLDPLTSRRPEDEAAAVEAAKRRAAIANPLPSEEFYNTPDGGVAPRPGSDAERARAEAARMAEQAKIREQRMGAIIVQDMDRALAEMDAPNRLTAGVPGALNRVAQSYIPGTSWYDLKSHLDAAEATVSLQNLQELKLTTGAGLGNVSDKQSALLGAAYGAIDIAQSEPVLRDNLARLRNIYLDIIFGHGRGPERLPLSFQKEWVPEDEGWVDDNGNPIAAFGDTYREGQPPRGSQPGTVDVDPAALSPAARRLLGL
jgi:hypothetical protein